jgi:antitoxin HicB
MLRYPIKLAKDTNGTLLVTAPDFAEVTTFGEDVEDAILHASDAIASAMQGRITDRKEIPPPSKIKRGHHAVIIPALVVAKLELYRAMLDARISKSRLAKRLGVHNPQVDRLLDLDHGSTIEQIENAARALGKEMYIELRPAA